MLCEDGPTNQLLIKQIMDKVGVKVSTADNGVMGLDAIRDQPDAYDLVLMDMQMPVMDGYTAARDLRDIGYDRPIIALTAHAMRGNKERCLEAGCSGYLTKPLDFDQFLSTISETLKLEAALSA